MSVHLKIPTRLSQKYSFIRIFEVWTQTLGILTVKWMECVKFLTPLSCCPDNNECETEPCGHGRGICVNIEGGYKCYCRQGYKHMVQHGRLKCIGKLGQFRVSFCKVIKRCIGSVLAVLQMWMSAPSKTSVVSEAIVWTCPALTNVNVTAALGASHTVIQPVKVQAHWLLWHCGY